MTDWLDEDVIPTIEEEPSDDVLARFLEIIRSAQEGRLALIQCLDVDGAGSWTVTRVDTLTGDDMRFLPLAKVLTEYEVAQLEPPTGFESGEGPFIAQGE